MQRFQSDCVGQRSDLVPFTAGGTEILGECRQCQEGQKFVSSPLGFTGSFSNLWRLFMCVSVMLKIKNVFSGSISAEAVGIFGQQMLGVVFHYTRTLQAAGPRGLSPQPTSHQGACSGFLGWEGRRWAEGTSFRTGMNSPSGIFHPLFSGCPRISLSPSSLSSHRGHPRPASRRTLCSSFPPHGPYFPSVLHSSPFP